MTAEEFEQAYAERSGFALDTLREYRTVRPCDCGDESCEGWQSISHERAAEYDAAHRIDAPATGVRTPASQTGAADTLDGRIKAVVIEWLGARFDAEGRLSGNPDYVQEEDVDELVTQLLLRFDAPANGQALDAIAEAIRSRIDDTNTFLKIMIALRRTGRDVSEGD